MPIIRMLDDAVKDLDEGRVFYQKHGVGNYFWDSLLSDIESLLIHSGVHLKEHGFYRMLAKRFPYAIYYDIRFNFIDIIAVLPIRRNPLWIQTKMSGRR
ncbi:type II toxin-antitoxin system RelE/ParE family toxin [Methylotuvimicrobium sp. KM1]|uniref:type II toxin-antitoxin system RelE/ParE family toxin n=1 Tax=Methylotuvimicrobium sp. KM1 TaxID=3377707 RepID=UPI00384DB483